MGGTPKRMEHFANYIMKEIGHKLPAGTTLLDITKNSYRYSMYKVGPVLSISVSIPRFENVLPRDARRLSILRRRLIIEETAGSVERFVSPRHLCIVPSRLERDQIAETR